MNYTHLNADGQMEISSEACHFLMIPSLLEGFSNSDTTTEKTKSGRTVHHFWGVLSAPVNRCCPCCGSKMHVNNHLPVNLQHLPFGDRLTDIKCSKLQLKCSKCNATVIQNVPFKADGHRITVQLLDYVKGLLSRGCYTNKEVAELTGLNENTIKSIDKQRLLEKYTVDGKTLIKPEAPAKFLGIDEFKLHNGHKYATHIIDLETGHVLWISHGKKKQVVYDFIDHVGLEWMNGVEAVACDMNSDFQEAFEEKCPDIQIVFDHFHIIKNFNEKVVSEIRKDEQRRLILEGNLEAANALKKTKYILTASRKTLEEKDAAAKDGKVFTRGGNLFSGSSYTLKEGYVRKYEKLISENKLLFTVDLIKEKLAYAFQLTDEIAMAKVITEIIELCTGTGNRHLLWFKNLLDKHFEGIIAHATYRISSGKIEGINNKIKTVRRQAYGYGDDDYFFLKILDISRSDGA